MLSQVARGTEAVGRFLSLCHTPSYAEHSEKLGVSCQETIVPLALEADFFVSLIPSAFYAVFSNLGLLSKVYEEVYHKYLEDPPQLHKFTTISCSLVVGAEMPASPPEDN